MPMWVIPKDWLGKFAPPSKFHESDVRPSGTIRSTLHPLHQNALNKVCSCWKADSNLPYQDCWLRPLQRTLAYAQALQYLAGKANPPVPSEPHHLAMCIHKLRWHMQRYMTFSDHDVFEGLAHGLPRAEVEEATQPNPIEPLLADNPAVLTIAPSTLEDMSATLNTTPAILEEELVALVTTHAAPADELANPPTPSKTTGDARSPTEPEYLKWVKVHLS